MKLDKDTRSMEQSNAINMQNKYGDVLLTIADSVATLQFDRPYSQKHNELNLHADMTNAINDLNNNNDIKVIAINGAEDSFYDGMDLENFYGKCMEDNKFFKKVIDMSYQWWNAIKGSHAATICSISGDCFGASILLVGICDFAIASDDARFRLSGVNFDILPAGWTSWAVGKESKMKQGFFFSLIGETFYGVRAAELGLINKSVPADELQQETDKLVECIASIVNEDKLDLPYMKRVYDRMSELYGYEAYNSKDILNTKPDEKHVVHGDGEELASKVNNMAFFSPDTLITKDV